MKMAHPIKNIFHLSMIIFHSDYKHVVIFIFRNNNNNSIKFNSILYFKILTQQLQEPIQLQSQHKK
jgi:hypothetical protein